MDFSTFLHLVPKIIAEPLPGIYGHNIMVPLSRIALMKNIDLKKITPRKAAVLMLFYPKQNETHLVLILRNSYPGVHSSQVAFPGGKVENFDISLEATALRETNEEIGISSEKVKLVKPFSQVYIPPSNFMVFPFLGYSEEALVFFPDPTEVAAIIELPVSIFLDEHIVTNAKISTSYMDSIEVPAFKIENHLVWGATAMMLSELKEIFKKIL